MSIHPVMQRLADKLKRTDLPAFVPGDQIRVQVKIKEGDKERLQAFEGLVIAINKGPQGTFTVRKMSFGQGVERIFPFNSRVVDKVELVRSYKVRRAKLFYLRELRGKRRASTRAAGRKQKFPRMKVIAAASANGESRKCIQYTPRASQIAPNVLINTRKSPRTDQVATYSTSSATRRS